MQIDETNASDSVTIEATLLDVSNLGDIMIGFNPPIVAVPNDWNSLWSVENLAKLTLEDREVFEKELKNIMNV